MSAEPSVSGSNEAPARPRLQPWMKVALAVTALCFAGAGAWYFVNEPKVQRTAPGIDLRHQAAGVRLRKAQNVSPTEEYPGPDGKVVYLTQEQFRVANAAASLPLPGYDRQLAAALAIEDPDARAKKLVEIVESPPRGEEGDATVLSLWALVIGALAAPPQTAVQKEGRARVDAAIGCRFVPRAKSLMPIPKCASPATLVPAYVMAGVGAAPLVLVLGAALVRRKRPAAPAPADARKRAKRRRADGDAALDAS
ncbi:MAG: hypothetical protein IPG04_08700 [Polyangiaceae bacterium]|nr:hypothetical protein [Polyangiaceae bacterium]